MKRFLYFFLAVAALSIVLFLYLKTNTTSTNDSNPTVIINKLDVAQNTDSPKEVCDIKPGFTSNKSTIKASNLIIASPTSEKEKRRSMPSSFNFSVGEKVLSGVVNPNGSGNWKCIGPFGIPEVKWTATGNGAVDHVAFHPTKPAVMYISVRNGGLFKTIDYGKHWVPIVDDFCSGAKCLAVSKSNPMILYFGTDSQLWFTEDEGKSWYNRDLPNKGTTYDIQIDPTDPSTLIVANSLGLYRSTNKGVNWSLISSGVYTDISFTDDWSYIAVAKNYANSQNPPGYFASIDKGLSWKFVKVTTEYTLIDKTYVGIYGKGADMQIFAYLLSEHGANNGAKHRYLGLYKSTDAGANFTRIVNPNYNYPNGPVALSKNSSGALIELDDTEYASINLYTSATWISHFFVDPNNPDNLTLIREKIWMSDNGGQTWKQNFSYGGSNWADNRYIATNIAQDTVFWCNDGGIWSCALKDFTPTGPVSKLVPKLGDLAIQEGTQCDVSLMNKRVFMTGGQDLGQFFTRNGRDSHVASSDVYRGRICPFDDTKYIYGEVLVKSNNVEFKLYDYINPGHFDQKQIYGFTHESFPTKLLRSKKGENAWNIVGFKGETVANLGGRFCNSTVSNWEELINITALGITNLKPGTFEESWANENIGFFGDEIGLKAYITNNLTNSSPTWIRLTNAPAMTKYRFATHPKYAKVVAVAGLNAVYISRNKGESWTKKGSFVGNPIVMLYDSTSTEGLYIATDKTIYYTDNTLSDWIEFNKLLPNDHITDMRMVHYKGGDSRLVISKYGRGVWESPLYSVIAKNQKPFPDFVVSSTSSDIINKDKVVILNDLSGNCDSVSWKIEHESGKFSLSAGNLLEPSFILPYSGYYHVSQTGYNSNGDSTLTKLNYILVNYPSCTTLGSENLSVVSADSEVNPASYAFDGDKNTYWLSSNGSQPHEIIVKLQKEQVIVSAAYFARKDAVDGRVADFEVYVSNDGINWGSSVAKAKLTNTVYPQTINLSPRLASYLKFVVLSEVKGLNMAAIAELSLCTTDKPIIDDISSIEKIEKAENYFYIYPNPNNGLFQIKSYSVMNGDLKIKVLNSSGREVYNNIYVMENSIFNTEINLGTLPKGMYIVKLYQVNKSESLKFLVQ